MTPEALFAIQLAGFVIPLVRDAAIVWLCVELAKRARGPRPGETRIAKRRRP